MSAPALMSVIASTMPVSPRGSSGEAVTDFGSLLEALNPHASDSQVHPEAEAVISTATDKTGDTSAEVGFLITPSLLASPAIATVPEADAGSGSGSTVPVEGNAPDPVPQATSPLPDDKTLPSKPTAPPVQPPEPGVRRLERASAGDVQLTLDEVPTPEGNSAAPTKVLPPPPTPPSPSQVQPTPPQADGQIQALLQPPLKPSADGQPRPLTERGSRADGPLTARSVEPTATDGFKPAAAPAATTATSPEPAAGQTSKAEVPVIDPAEAISAEAPATDLPPTVEAPPAGASTAGIAREASLSTLSQATIDATAQIAAQILRRLEGRSTRFEMALTPDELGRVDVRLDIDSEGRLNARLAFDNPLAATDLKGRVDDLRRQLEDAGFHLAEDAFEFTDRDQGSSAFDRGQNARDHQSRAFTAASRLKPEIDLAQPPRWLSLSLSPSGVDMKV